jgi:hypothetical protein
MKEPQHVYLITALPATSPLREYGSVISEPYNSAAGLAATDAPGRHLLLYVSYRS